MSFLVELGKAAQVAWNVRNAGYARITFRPPGG
jgi:hypothetical protein